MGGGWCTAVATFIFVPDQPGILALGPWSVDQVQAVWDSEVFQHSPEAERAADVKVAELQRRGSPSYDGLSARLAGSNASRNRLALECQPARWSRRTLAGTAE